MSTSKTIRSGSKVTLELELRLDDGELVSSTKEDKEPLEAEIGIQQLPPGLEAELMGKKEGDTFSITVEADEGYGDYDEEAFEMIDKEAFADAEIEEGEDYFFEDEEGQMVIVNIAEITDEGVVVDYNHPLAGERLSFSGTILKVD